MILPPQDVFFKAVMLQPATASWSTQLSRIPPCLDKIGILKGLKMMPLALWLHHSKYVNTSLAVPGALAHRLQHLTARLIQNGRRGLERV